MYCVMLHLKAKEKTPVNIPNITITAFKPTKEECKQKLIKELTEQINNNFDNLFYYDITLQDCNYDMEQYLEEEGGEF